MTVALASPVYVEGPRKEVLKSVRGQLLRREESYTEAVEDDFKEELTNTPSSEEKAEDVVVVNKSSLSEDQSFIGPALKRNIRAWREATGLPTTITIRFRNRVFHLHKFPLVSRSGYLKRLLKDLKEATIPSDCPGGPDIFELVANFCYGSTILMEPSNIAELRCVAEYLQMSEDYGRANLCERTDLYLTQVALQSWEDTLVVLLHCECIAPLAEQLRIVSRCIESLAFMACMELLNPADRKGRPSMSGEIQYWSDFGTNARDSASHEWWIEDLVGLPPNLFVRLIVALRREAMQEHYVGRVITGFADRWIFRTNVDTVLVQESRAKCWVLESPAKPNPCMLIESVVRMLPLERTVVPVGFLFALLRCGLACGLNDDCRIQLETRITLQLEQACVDDLLLPSKKEKDSGCVPKGELESMERIVKLFFSRHRGFNEAGVPNDKMKETVPGFSQCIQTLSTVSKLWDEYLTEITYDASLTPTKFADLVDKVPAYTRIVHDHVYRAIHSYLKAHPSTTQEERLTVCRTLNCQKLSLEACTHAVQNELMPLRMIVQAMFMQQLQTRTALTSHLESAAQSFRSEAIPYHSRQLVPNVSSPLYADSGRLHGFDFDLARDSFRSIESYQDDLHSDDSRKYLAKRDSLYNASSAPPPKVDYAATENRLQSLEAELGRMRKVLSESRVEEASSLRRGVASNPSQIPHTGLDNKPSGTGRSGQLGVIPMPTVHEGQKPEGANGCMSQIKQANRSSGLFAKTLQKLKFGSFRRSKKAEKQINAAAPTEGAAAEVGRNEIPKEASLWQSEEGRFQPVTRTDSMPRPVTSRELKHKHVRHNSMH